MDPYTFGLTLGSVGLGVMITVVIIVLGATVHILTPYLPGNRER